MTSTWAPALILSCALALTGTGCSSADAAADHGGAEQDLTEDGVIATAIFEPDHVRVAGDTLLYATTRPLVGGGQTGQVWARPLAGGTPRLVAELEHPVADMAVMDGDLWVTAPDNFDGYGSVGHRADGRVTKIDIATGRPSEGHYSLPVVGAWVDSAALAARGRELYVGHDTGEVVRVDTNVAGADGRPKAKLVAKSYTTSSFHRTRGIAVGTRTLYWANNEYTADVPPHEVLGNWSVVLYAAPLDGSAPPRQLATFDDTGPVPVPIATDGDTLYAAIAGHDPQVGVYAFRDGARVKLVEGLHWPSALLVDERGLLFGDEAYGIGLVPRALLGSASPAPFSEVALRRPDTTEHVASLAVAGGRLYYAAHSESVDPGTGAGDFFTRGELRSVTLGSSSAPKE